jgi:hypothetical protein
MLLPTTDERSSWGVPAAVTIAMVGGFLFVVCRHTLAREREMRRSYRLALGQHVVRRVVAGVDPVELLRSEVTRIVA